MLGLFGLRLAEKSISLYENDLFESFWSDEKAFKIVLVSSCVLQKITA